VTLNPHSWHGATNLMFIDQPVGTGLAYTRNRKHASDDQQVSAAFYRMLLAFFALHPSYVAPAQEASGVRVTRPVVLAGESHAGHYIPCMTKYILAMNAEARRQGGGGLVINIDGLAIGNGWIDPFHQYDVSDYAHGQGLISDGQRHTMKVRPWPWGTVGYPGSVDLRLCAGDASRI
jgi:carboxypeptidase D